MVFQDLSIISNRPLVFDRSCCPLNRLRVRDSCRGDDLVGRATVKETVYLDVGLCFIIRAGPGAGRLGEKSVRAFVSDLMLPDIRLKSTRHFLSAVPVAMPHSVSILIASQGLVPDLDRHHAFL